ncbi:MAG: IscS subfamily cysteine desulfurase [Candidatus Omnitrophota bacterium]
MNKAYFDYAATTPTDPLVLEAMRPFFFEKFGNASSPHEIGREAKQSIEDARQLTASFINAGLDEIIFTSGATESNNHAIFGAARALRSKGNHIIASAIEHHSVSEALLELQKDGFKITFVGVDHYGLINPDDIKAAITDKTILISVMHANNEIGVIQSIAQIGKIAREQKILFHCDAVQALGRTTVNVKDLNVDLLSASAHKFYGPKGVGFLFVRKGVKLPSFLIGGGQERGRRASTQNTPGIVGLGKAVELLKQRMDSDVKIQIALHDRLIYEIPKHIEHCRLNGHPAQRLSNIVNFSFSGIDGEALLMSLDMAGIHASMGSACTSGAMEASHVLKAIGVSDELALGSLRLSLGRWTTSEEVDYLLEQLPKIIASLRKLKSGKS